MANEVFYGVTLSEKEPLSQFELSLDGDYFFRQLVIKQITLGVEAKEGEFNVVQAEARISDKETIKIPIAVLKVGETRILRPNIEFSSPSSVTFKLIQGTGPVHILGQQVHDEVEYEDGQNIGMYRLEGEDEEDFEEEEEEGGDEHEKNGQTKGHGKNATNHKKK